MLSFEEINSLPHPDIQTDFMVYLRLSKCMSRLLYTCRYTEFKLPDITNPNPQRLRSRIQDGYFFSWAWQSLFECCLHFKLLSFELI